MDQNDRHAIESLFGKLSEVERQAGPRDSEAEGFIRERIAAQPGAPYFMAQTIVVQEQALDSAQRRIEELEYELANRPQQAASGGGLLSSLFGSGSRPSPQARAASRHRRPGSRPRPDVGSGWPLGATARLRQPTCTPGRRWLPGRRGADRHGRRRRRAARQCHRRHVCRRYSQRRPATCRRACSGRRGRGYRRRRHGRYGVLNSIVCQKIEPHPKGRGFLLSRIEFYRQRLQDRKN